MKQSQKLLFTTIILLPVIIGIVLLISERTSAPLTSSVSFKEIGLIQLQGEIIDATELLRQLKSMRLDNTIAGVLLRINSPGGAVAPSQELYTEVLRYREQKKPIVVSMGTVAASGGYYIASAASRIFADPGTITGSIGVIFSLPMIQDLSRKLGIEFRVYKAGKFKDMGSMNRPMTEEERTVIQGFLDDTHQQFIHDVAVGRSMSFDSVKAVADGRIYTGRQALKIHLIDTLGGYEDALQFIKDETGLSAHARVVSRRPHASMLKDMLTEEITRLIPFATPSHAGGIYYLIDPSYFKF